MSRQNPDSWRSAIEAEEGSAVIEMAVSLTALLLVIIGMMKMCLAVYTYHYTSEAAREGARWAIVRGATCVSGGSSCTAQDSDVSSYVKNLLYPALDPTKMTVSVSRSGFPSGVVCSPSTTCNNPGNMITVTVQYAFPLSIPFRASRTLNMSSTSAGIIAQ